MSREEDRPAGRTPARTGPFAVLACCIGLIIVADLMILSLIHDDDGWLGVSREVSIAVAGALILGAMETMRRVIWRAFTETPPKPSALDEAGGLRRKCDLRPDEWFAILEEAKQEFYIAGHSMGDWCSASNEARFIDELRRILGAGGGVTLVMLGPDSPLLAPLQAATERDYSNRIHHSLRALGQFESSLDPVHLSRLQVTKLEDHAPIPYMVVGNERRMLTATYLARTDSDHMPCLELDRESEAGRAIYDDFHKLANGAT